MKIWSRTISVVLATCLSSAAVADVVYKWTDTDGRTIYSQTPPPAGIDYVVVEQKYATPVTENSGSTSKSLSTSSSPSADNTGDSKTEKERVAESENIKAENCEKARKNLTSLTSRGQVTIKEGDLYRKLTEEERQEKITENQQMVDEFCK